MTGELAVAAFLLRTGLTYDEYVAMPDRVISDMMLLVNSEAEYQQSQVRQQNSHG